MTASNAGPPRTSAQDLSAGLVVFLVALPLCLGVALASTGRSDLLFTGLVAGVVGGVVVGALSGSAVGVSGPAAGLVTIVLSAIQTLGSYESFLVAVVLAGALQVVAGLARAGVIAHYFPSSVIKGMLAAIGLTLILKQVPHALGIDSDYMGDEAFAQPDGRNTFSELTFALGHSSPGAIVIAGLSLLILAGFETRTAKSIRALRYLPGALAVVLVGVGLNALFGALAPQWAMSGAHLVQLPVAASLGDVMGFVRQPELAAITNPEVWGVALTLAIVASLETLLSVEATDKLDPLRRVTPTDRELKAQGIGNIVSGLLGGLPVTQVIVRSTANVNAGGGSRVATLTHGVILGVAVLAFPEALNHIPLATLAAILLLTGYKLSKPSLYVAVFRLGLDQFVPFIVTVVSILLTDLLRGIGLGMATAAYFILLRAYRDKHRERRTTSADGAVQVEIALTESNTFLHKGSLLRTLEELPDGCSVLIHTRNTSRVDHDILELLEDFRTHRAPLRDIRVDVVEDLPSHTMPRPRP
jgi:MFS superfamily sulfate permease-like transporter